MKKMIKHLGIVAGLMLAVLFGCDNDNDFYEVGRQQVFLTYPQQDTLWVLDYQKPDTLYRFAWESKRQYIYFDLVFGLDAEFSGKTAVVPTGIKRENFYTTIKLDSILSSMDIGIGEKRDIYWTVKVLDEEAGWCDDIRKISITRCDLPANVILLSEPAAEAEVALNKEEPEGLVTFSWDCKAEVKDYTLFLSFNEEFENPVEIKCGSAKSYDFTAGYLDNLMQEQGAELGESTPVYWKVTGTGTSINPIENSAAREISVKRFSRDPVEVTIVSPVQGSTILLEVDYADELFEFKWECDTTGVSFQIKLYDAELGVIETFDAGENNSFSISQSDFDLLLEQKYEMVASQKKKMFWELIPSDPLRAVSETVGEFTIRRFAAVIAAQPIVFTNAPADGTTYTLSYATPDAVLASLTWDCGARNVTYALEYSLNPDMSNSKIKPLTMSKSVDFTHALLDDMLSDVDGSYLTKTLYWRITTTVSVTTEPTEIRSMNLTGMLKPFVDKRDPASSETYQVVKIGNDFWMAENMRATKYSDGTAFTTVDLDVRQFLGGAVSDPKLIGYHYTWPTALRNYDLASTSETTVIQGICPPGWHISTMKEWKDLIAVYPGGAAAEVKKPGYWQDASATTNNSGLSVVPGGQYWHGNYGGDPDGAGRDGKAGFWTTTVGSAATTAYMYEVFNDRWNPDPWAYNARPWSEGDSTASKSVKVRCVRDQN